MSAMRSGGRILAHDLSRELTEQETNIVSGGVLIGTVLTSGGKCYATDLCDSVSGQCLTGSPGAGCN